MAKLAINGGPRVIPLPKASTDAKTSTDVKKPSVETQERLAREFADYCGAKYARAYAWGTGALTAAMVAADVGPGDEVIVPSFTWPASVNCVLHLNGIPVFADIDPKTFTLDVNDVKRKTTSRTKAIIPVDFYGHPADIPALMKLVKGKNILVVEDACQATGAEINGKKVGGLAHLTAFSFSGKPITSSQGGILTTNNLLLYEKALVSGEHTSFLSQLKTKWLREKYTPSLGYGFKYRMDPHAAKIALKQLAQLDHNNNERIKNCNILTDSLRGIPGLTTPYVAPWAKHVYHYYTCLYDAKQYGVPREKFLKALEAEGLSTCTYVNSANFMYFPGGKYVSAGPIHHRPIFQEKNLYGRGCPFLCPHAKRKPDYSIGSLPVTEKIVNEEFSISQGQLYKKPYGDGDRKKMQLYVDAIVKVIENVDELRK